jgi:hypothetical protein
MTVRKSLTDAIVFFRPSKNEMKSIADDLLDDDIDVRKLVDFSFKKKYDWLFMNLENQRFYNSDFQELIL